MIQEDYSTLLADYMIGKFQLAQIRRQMYYADAIYDHIPCLFFFLKEDSTTRMTYEKLASCIERFQGNLKWILCKCEPSRKNYAIAPIITFEHINEDRSIGKMLPKDKMQEIREYEQICNDAILDIPKLVKKIEQNYR